MSKKLTLLIAALLLSTAVVGITVNGRLGSQRDDFSSLNSEEMHARIVAERDYAIQKAVSEGDYKCCIEPPCTMCYMEANQWNNYTPGTCACDDLIAKGEDPCPQCMSGVCNKNSDGTCKLNDEI